MVSTGTGLPHRMHHLHVWGIKHTHTTFLSCKIPNTYKNREKGVSVFLFLPLFSNFPYSSTTPKIHPSDNSEEILWEFLFVILTEVPLTFTGKIPDLLEIPQSLGQSLTKNSRSAIIIQQENTSVWFNRNLFCAWYWSKRLPSYTQLQ